MHSIQYKGRLTKILILEGILKNISYERRVYESVDDVVLVAIQNLPVLMTTGYPISFPPVLKMCFFGMQAVSGRISRPKDYA